MQNSDIQHIISALGKWPQMNLLTNALAADQSTKIHLKGGVGSFHTLCAAYLFSETQRNIWLVLNDQEQAVYWLNELEAIYGKENVLYYPASYRRPYQIEEVNNANVVLRSEVLNKLSGSKNPKLVITYATALTEKVVSQQTFNKNILEVKVGAQLSVTFLNEMLFEHEFQRVDFVTEPGEFSVRGGIVDVFSYADESPYRISFFGEEIESIRKFDIETQLSTELVNAFTLLPNLENKFSQENRQSILEFVPKDTLWVMDNVQLSADTLKDIFQKAETAFDQLSGEIKRATPEALFLQAQEFFNHLKQFAVVELSSLPYFEAQHSIQLTQTPQPSFHKNFELLSQTLKSQHENGIQNYIFCSSQKQIDRLQEIFQDLDAEIPFSPVLFTLHEGFIDQVAKISCFTDHQIFERYHRFKLRDSFTQKDAITLQELTHLQIGDYVTHIDHGVGKFAGLKRIEVNGIMQEAIKLVYRDNDLLYVNIHSLHKISKFSGKDGQEPKINKLGSPAWKNLKNKTKRKVKEVAFDLIKLYAKRKMEKGFAFSPDDYMQTELEASFMYEDTPDQLKATEDVKRDMESDKVMDRLVCGDVGFGKTEVAIRAAFKAVNDGKQVAVLVPTTILAFQHYNTFKERLQDFPVKIAYLNRFKTAKEKTEILKQLADGQIDIIIGTHQLAGKSVKYKDLGLLIVDEEHKFGVSVKDKLKTLRAKLDTLTLTATPIPRTLQFSLMAARDLSVIKTPPPNRQPVETHLIGLNEEQIRDAVSYELQRDGQVFVIFNRIEGLKEMAGMIQRLVPEAKVAIGHGQMDGKKLEKTLLDFMSGKFDVLVSTTIVESGVDVPNANTMLIVDAQNFGLADLHQMRGRVGRSNRKAFCYLVTPPLVALTNEARKRLKAIEQFSDLGAGFNIALKDLEIRGAGNLLGAEQSGFMAEMGFDTYQKILNEAVEELKHSDDFKELFQDQNLEEPEHYVSDFNFDTDLELLLPHDYVNSVEERMILYQKLTEIETPAELQKYQENLVDRFGALPHEAQQLLHSIELKWISQQLGFEKVFIKKNTFLGYFVSDAQSSYYQSATFQNILATLQQNPSLAKLKEKVQRGHELPTLLLRIDGVKTIQQALNKLQLFLGKEV